MPTNQFRPTRLSRLGSRPRKGPRRMGNAEGLHRKRRMAASGAGGTFHRVSTKGARNALRRALMTGARAAVMRRSKNKARGRGITSQRFQHADGPRGRGKGLTSRSAQRVKGGRYSHGGRQLTMAQKKILSGL